VLQVRLSPYPDNRAAELTFVALKSVAMHHIVLSKLDVLIQSRREVESPVPFPITLPQEAAEDTHVRNVRGILYEVLY
jgi:hypothetical protein